MKLSEIKHEQLLAERKCKRELMYFLFLCVAVFIVAPLVIVASIRYGEEIDNFFNLKRQIILFLSTILLISIGFIVRWWRK